MASPRLADPRVDIVFSASTVDPVVHSAFIASAGSLKLRHRGDSWRTTWNGPTVFHLVRADRHAVVLRFVDAPAHVVASLLPAERAQVRPFYPDRSAIDLARNRREAAAAKALAAEGCLTTFATPGAAIALAEAVLLALYR